MPFAAYTAGYDDHCQTSRSAPTCPLQHTAPLQLPVAYLDSPRKNPQLDSRSIASRKQATAGSMPRQPVGGQNRNIVPLGGYGLLLETYYVKSGLSFILEQYVEIVGQRSVEDVRCVVRGRSRFPCELQLARLECCCVMVISEAAEERIDLPH